MVELLQFEFVGNGSVRGAELALLSHEALEYLRVRIAGAMTDFELSTNHRYMNEYSSCLFLPHTNLEKFPSLAREHAGGLVPGVGAAAGSDGGGQS